MTIPAGAGKYSDALAKALVRLRRPFALVLMGAISLAGLSGTAMAEQSESDYHNDPWTFLLFSFVMSFGAVSFVMGLFALKYGKKRTRVYSIPMIMAGTFIWALWIYFKLVARAEYPEDTVFGIIHWVAAPLLLPIMALVGAGLGFAVALIIFLNTIVRA